MEDATLRSGQVLITGLGNPGSSYALTRHNFGQATIGAMAQDLGWSFKKSDRLNGKVANGMLFGLKVFLLMPSTYMNNSGLSVRKCIDYFKIPVENVMIVADDINIPFGTLRLREKGGDGGHNGLKSVEAHLHSNEYHRLRMGIGNTFIGNLEDYVLGNFAPEEIEAMPNIFKEAEAVLETWIKGDVHRAKELASSAKSTLTQGENE